jgi:uncharacterized protein YkwD
MLIRRVVAIPLVIAASALPGWHGGEHSLPNFAAPRGLDPVVAFVMPDDRSSPAEPLGYGASQVEAGDPDINTIKRVASRVERRATDVFESIATAQQTATRISPPTTPPPTTAPPAPPNGTATSLELLNAIRASVGAPPLAINSTMSNFALGWSQEMSPSGLRHSSWPDGENTAWYSNGSITPQAAAVFFNNAWGNSPGHYSNMINASYTEVGIGLFGDSSGWWATLVFR